MIQAKGGMLIRAKKDLRGVSNSYNTPERIDIKKGTLLLVPPSGTRMGDCFCNLAEGKATLHCRGHNEGELEELKPNATIGLREGYSDAPYSLGTIDTECWDIENMSTQSVTLSLTVNVNVMDDTSIEDVQELARKEFLKLIKNTDEYQSGIEDISTV